MSVFEIITRPHFLALDCDRLGRLYHQLDYECLQFWTMLSGAAIRITNGDLPRMRATKRRENVSDLSSLAALGYSSRGLRTLSDRVYIEVAGHGEAFCGRARTLGAIKSVPRPRS